MAVRVVSKRITNRQKQLERISDPNWKYGQKRKHLVPLKRDDGSPRKTKPGTTKWQGKYKTCFRKGSKVGRWRTMAQRSRLTIPRNYSTDRAQKISRLVAEGQTLKQIAENPENWEWGCPKQAQTLYNWYHRVPEFKEFVDIATQHKADLAAEQIYDIIERVENGTLDLSKAKFLSDQHKWLAERLAIRFKQERTPNLTVNAGEGGKIDFKILLAPQTQTALPAPAEDIEYEEITEEEKFKEESIGSSFSWDDEFAEPETDDDGQENDKEYEENEED